MTLQDCNSDSLQALRVLFKEINVCVRDLEVIVETCSDLSEGKEFDTDRFLNYNSRKTGKRCHFIAF